MVVEISVTCWRCEEPGHIAVNCRRPPARTPAELDARIARHVERWDAGYGVISTRQKTEFIKTEISEYEKARKVK